MASESPDRDRWSQTLTRIANSVVALEVARVRPFDFSEQGISTATGFVVDAENGIILTNRHVIGSGPLTATATFQNQERVTVVPLYRDPVHDFGFFRFQPTDLERIAPESLVLRPDKAATGLDIRVVGSDGGEQLSILAGTIARLDRPVPNYGRYSYNDFNTFYMQAASSTSGGSSGSPVIDVDGNVVALNAAANSNTASSFFLPLDRIVRALDLLREDKTIARGTMQTLFHHQPFRQLRRIGLQADVESKVRSHDPDTTGMLVVGQVIAGGVAMGLLEEGDILFSINDQAVTQFVRLEALLDSHVGEMVKVQVQRQLVQREFEIPIADFHALQPDAMVEVGGAILHNMTLQAARATNKAQEGVLLADRGYMFARANMSPGAVIVEINGQPMRNLDDFIELLQSSTDGDQWFVRYYVARREFTTELARVIVDRRWFGSRRCYRVDDQAHWPCESIAVPTIVADADTEAQPQLPQYREALIGRIAPALVTVSFDIPHPVDNVYARHFTGTGLVVDADRGLVAVDRNTVPITLGDAQLIFFESLEIKGKVVFVHPLHNVALVKYNPQALGDLQITPVKLGGGDLRDNTDLAMIGFKPNGSLLQHRIRTVTSQTLDFDLPRLPRYQQVSIDVFNVPDMPTTIGGAISDEAGTVHSLWSSFAYPGNKSVAEGEWALPADVIREALDLYRDQLPLRVLGASLSYIPLASARQLGLPDVWWQRIAIERGASLAGRRVPMVRRVASPKSDKNQSESILRVGDLLLAIDGEPISDLRDVELRVQSPDVSVTLLRNGLVEDHSIKTQAVQNAGTQRVVNWAGAYLQAPHREVATQRGVRGDAVYVSSTVRGSPANRDGLYRNRMITAVDGEPVSSLDDFLRLVANKEQNEDTRLTLVSLSGHRALVSVRPEYNFWPTFELQNNGQGWQRIEHFAKD
ncbi:MAG: PDZ domain-containing protein [Pseudomonadota bacterium]